MSFSAEVKDEVSRQISSARHCQISELAAIFSMCGSVMISSDDKLGVKIVTENVAVARKFYKLVKMAFKVDAEIAISSSNRLNKGNVYTVIIRKDENARTLLMALKIIDEYGQLVEDITIGGLLTQQPCCKRAFIRGAFMAAGSISDPNKFYHFEIVTNSESKAKHLMELINFFELDSKVVARKKHYVVYIKEGTQIVEVLSVMGAHVALMNLENVRIIKEMRNSVNRKVNCETANLNKTVSAALKQVKDIEYIRDTVGLESLKPELCEIAKIRLENVDVPLKDLGKLLTEPVGKSGVNHRLKKISEIAEDLRGYKEENYGNKEHQG